MKREKADLEQLLNNLIEKGWKPRQHTDFVRCNYCDTYSEFSFETENESWIWEHTIRQLVSKESWLRQFCVDKGMVRNEKLTHNWVSQVEWWLDVDCKRKTTPKDYEYRLIESALKDECEIEDFLLSNIKV